MFNLDYQSLCKDKRLYKNILGITQTEYEKLIPEFTKSLEQVRINRYLSNTNRKRGLGGGSKPKIFSKPSKLLFYILFFVRLYPTFDLAKLLFSLDRSQLHYWYELGLEALELTVKHKIKLPAEKTKNFKDLFTRVPELVLHIVDATEQPINKPKYNEQKYYSGKKKCHSIKRQVIINQRNKIIGISYSVEGKKHDKKLAEESKYLLHSPPKTTLLSDGGYIGLKHPKDLRHIKPHRKKPNKELTEEEKNNNKTISSIRVKVEHVICHLKYWKMFSNKLRYRKREYDNKVANIVAGIYNYKIG